LALIAGVTLSAAAGLFRHRLYWVSGNGGIAQVFKPTGKAFDKGVVGFQTSFEKSYA
jgi:hypothetical protein